MGVQWGHAQSECLSSGCSVQRGSKARHRCFARGSTSARGRASSTRQHRVDRARSYPLVEDRRPHRYGCSARRRSGRVRFVIVLDASALVDVVIDQHAKHRVLDHLEGKVVAPAHQLAEVLSALARLVRADVIDPEVARAAISEAAALKQEHVIPDKAQLRRALELQDNIRVLDGLYVALAEQNECPLLTTDARLAGANPPCDVILATSEGD